MFLLTFVFVQVAFGECFDWGFNSSTVLWNSDGSGFDVKTSRSFSTSQNYWFERERVRLRWQVKKWWLPAYAPGKYKENIDNFLFDGKNGVLYLFQESGDEAFNCTKLLLDSTVTNISPCVPNNWVNWIGDDTYAIADVRVNTKVPLDQQNEFLPDTSVLTKVSTGLPMQLRVRENGHYLLLLSLENFLLDSVFAIEPPSICQSAPVVGKFKEVNTWVPFYKNDYFE